MYVCPNFHWKLCVHRCILTRGPVSCGCHRKEGKRGDVLREALIHEDIWTTESKEKWKSQEKKDRQAQPRSRREGKTETKSQKLTDYIMDLMFNLFQKIQLFMVRRIYERVHPRYQFKKSTLLAYLGLSCTPSMYICQNLMYPSWLAVANTVPSGDRAPSLTRWRGRHETTYTISTARNLCNKPKSYRPPLCTSCYYGSNENIEHF